MNIPKKQQRMQVYTLYKGENDDVTKLSNKQGKLSKSSRQANSIEAVSLKVKVKREITEYKKYL